MSKSPVRLPSSYLTELSPEAGAAFRSLRVALQKSGPLDHVTCELIIIAGFAMQGFEVSFKIHSSRLLEGGTPKAAIQHAILVTLGANTSIFQIGRALAWLDEVEAEVKTS